ncbi:MAG: 50S ribosomal protein L6 [Candidatus Nealsonbacteria bacterium CG02_land_8_20_14_3_00_37_10]|uniref:Large ribosomal subunit protein uL6 n=2 Tax=Candidatus Nealsoniibacteriota TaxID=1817911 RepID=A0A2G9Z0F4_9BACT|nr:MAG: 50S ribosomal protein L6 [Candidatus Nealsonbacteria bacterium CG23_combo_of_CG06-09_8_20_14_all_37_18]PIV45219.1 MAG: 50S ribosomal protein L6 [Candidatus Nealsonbacteria bacterium CG02_land_8_20_14_3_00_37_10]
MSRVGKKPILIPQGVDVKIEGSKVIVKGSQGEISKEFRPEIKIETKDDKILVLPRQEKEKLKEIKALWGLTRTLVANMIEGVTAGFEKKLEIEGIGFKGEVSGEELVLYVGFSHSVKLRIPKGIKILVDKNIITVSGIDKELVGQFASIIRKVKPAEPYKGKGIKYVGEIIRRKVGKKVVTTGGK